MNAYTTDVSSAATVRTAAEAGGSRSTYAEGGLPALISAQESKLWSCLSWGTCVAYHPCVAYDSTIANAVYMAVSDTPYGSRPFVATKAATLGIERKTWKAPITTTGPQTKDGWAP